MKRLVIFVALLALLAGAVVATVVVVIDVTTPESDRPCTEANFGRRAWANRGAEGQDPPVPRQIEADFLVACPAVLEGRGRADVRGLLGRPERPERPADQARRRVWRYIIGVQRDGSENRVDAELLVVRFDRDGEVRDLRVTTP
jgi:hypothetical protein